MQSIHCKVLIVGAGPGGYVAAIRAGQLGLDTVIVEAGRSGGTCLIRGCIPSKALIHGASRFEEIYAHVDGKLGITVEQYPKLDLEKMMQWKNTIVDRLSTGVDSLLKKNGVTQIKGWAIFENGKKCIVETDEGLLVIVAEHVILANGSVPTELPHFPFRKNIISSTEALQLQQLPQHLIIIGAGYIGLELGIAFRKLGSEVTIIEGLERILPLFDKEMSQPIKTWLSKHNVNVIYQAKAQSARDENGKVQLQYLDENAVTQTISGDKLLVTVGRKPNTQGWGLENMCIDMNGAFIRVNDQCETAMHNVWAIGDLTGEPMLAHKASAQGEMVAEIIAGKRRVFNPASIPSVCFTEPEIVSVGMTLDQAKQLKIETIIEKFPFASVGRALTMEAGADGGFVRIIARKDNHLILGIQAVGAHVSELSNQYSLAIEMGACLEDLAQTIHAHPTLGEATMEAAMAALGLPVHK